MRPIDAIVILFVLSQVLALGVGVLLIDNQQTNPAFSALNVAPEEPSSVSNALYFMASILIGAGILLIILMMPFRHLLIMIIEFISTVAASFIVFFVILSVLGMANSDTLAFIAALVLYVARFLYLPFRNVLAVVASAGIGSVIGFSIDPVPVFVFGALIAVYDIIAVKWTGHMVAFAKHFMKHKTSFSVGFEGTRRKQVTEKGKKRWTEEPWMIELGTGDMAIASAITVVSYKLGSLIFPAVAIVASAAGLVYIMQRAAREKAIMPAMPAIVGFSIVALAIIFGLMSIIR